MASRIPQKILIQPSRLIAAAHCLPSSPCQTATMAISTAANSSIPSSQHTMIAHPLQETFLFLPFVAFFVSFYYLVSPFYKTPKQKSWILTATSSFIMTSCSLPFVFDYLSNGCSVKAIRTSSDVAFIANRLFQSYLVSYVSIPAHFKLY